MNIIIIEDEKPIADLLERFILKLKGDARIIDKLTTVKSAIDWFKNNEEPDLIFMDVHLEDGNSFAIFDEVEIEAPVIFTTGFDEYALKAFKVNSVDYLLKPIELEMLQKSLAKYDKLAAPKRDDQRKNLEKLLEQLKPEQKEYKSRFLVKSGKKYITVVVKEIAYLYTENKLVFLMTREGKRYLTDSSLEELEHVMDPDEFYRANRQFIIGFDSIAGIHSYFNGRLKLELQPKPPLESDVTISSKKVQDFKKWLDR